MKDERKTGLWLPQTEHIRGHRWLRYWLIKSYWPLGTIGSVYSLLAAILYQWIESCQEPQALENRIKWEIDIQYAGDAEMLLHINDKGNF